MLYPIATMKNPMKFLIYSALTLGVLFILARTVIWIYDYNRNLENPDSIVLVNLSNLSTNDLKVIWNATGTESQTLFENGTDAKETFKEYGHNYFQLLFKDSVLAEFRQFKYNNWHGHQYTFHIQQLNSSLAIKLLIEGPDTRNFERTK